MTPLINLGIKIIRKNLLIYNSQILIKIEIIVGVIKILTPLSKLIKLKNKMYRINRYNKIKTNGQLNKKIKKQVNIPNKMDGQ